MSLDDMNRTDAAATEPTFGGAAADTATDAVTGVLRALSGLDRIQTHFCNPLDHSARTR